MSTFGPLTRTDLVRYQGATDRFGAAAVRSFRVRFAAQVFPGDTLTCDGTVVRQDAGSLDVEMTCTTQDGTVAVYGWAAFTVTPEAQ